MPSASPGGAGSARDAHAGPVPEAAWAADAAARERGRVQVFNATRPGGLDGWTMAEEQYEAVRAHVLETIDVHAGEDGSVALQLVVLSAQERFAGSPLFPGGRLTNYVRYVKVDLEARCEVERLPGSPQRIRRATSGPDGAGTRDGAVRRTAGVASPARAGGRRRRPRRR